MFTTWPQTPPKISQSPGSFCFVVDVCLFVLFLFLTFFPGWKFCKIGGPQNLEIGALNLKKPVNGMLQ